MRSSASLWIAAPPERVYDLVADLSRWPACLPHYRYVRILERQDGMTRAAMSARRGRIPVFWEAVQTVEPGTRTIRFRHVRGITRGMDVVWTLTRERDGTLARVDHELQFQLPFIGEWVARNIIAREFIEPIVTRTLARFRAVAEGTA